MKIRHKLLLGFLPIALASVVTMTLFSQYVVRKVLVEEVGRHGLSTGLNLARSEQMARGFRTGTEQDLLPTLQQVMENAGALYVLVLDPSGRVLAHTNVAETGKTYTDAVSIEAATSDEPRRQHIEFRRQEVVDVAIPVWELSKAVEGEEFLLLGRPDVQSGRRLGTVRLGLSLADALDTAGQISKQVLWIISLVSVLTILLILFHMRATLRPVAALARAAERIGAGQVGQTVDVTTTDEIGDLAASFNKMSQDLAMTTVSRDFLDRVLRNMQDIVIVTEGDGTVRMVNERACILLQRPKADLVGRPVTELFAEGEDPLAQAPGMAGGDKATSRETTMRTTAGPPVPVLLGVTAIGEGGNEGAVLTATDITDRKRAEERIRASLEEKEVLLREIHHRVKNNLQIISSLLNLQAGQIQDPLTLEMIGSSQQRIASMALIHERLYRSDELARVDFSIYVRDLTDNLFEGYQGASQRVQLHMDVEQVLLGIDEAIPCGLIINELVLNALKHAFPDEREGTLSISFHRLGDRENQFVVRDDGVGLPPELDLETVDSLGVSLVAILVRQLGGTLELNREGGTEYRIAFTSRA